MMRATIFPMRWSIQLSISVIVASNCIIQGEDEVMFLDYRKQLKVLLDNVALLVSHQE